MDFSHTEDQEALRDLARKILSERTSAESIREIEQGGAGIDRGLWQDLAGASLLGACLPEDCGGMGLGPFELCLLLEEVGRAVAPVPLWSTLTLAALPLARFGPAEQRERWLPQVASGELILGGALQEADGDDAGAPSTRAERDGDGWRLFGTKICVPAADLAERLLVNAATPDGELLLVWVDPRAAEATLERGTSTHRQPLFSLRLEGVRAEPGDLLARGTRAEEALRDTIALATTGLCALQVGVAERALHMTAEYTRDRKQFDRPIGSFQAVHQRAGDAYINVEAMRLTTLQAAHKLAQGEDAELAVSVAKIWAADGGNQVCYAAQHLHGGIGLDVDYPLHRSYLWTRHIELTLGSAERHLERVGRALAAGPAAPADY